MAKYNISVNENRFEIDATPSTPLLWVLRDIVGLTGTKYGCGIGQCGACTVHMDGESIRSCSIPISDINSANIRTIEGLANGYLHPVQQSWIDEQVPQCGYCQAGQIMSAVALLEKNTNPTEEEIKSNMAGNLCRCGTYPRIIKAIKAAASKIK